MEDRNAILTAIEELRGKLEKLINDKGTENEDVLIASRLLDTMLNDYYKILNEKIKGK